MLKAISFFVNRVSCRRIMATFFQAKDVKARFKPVEALCRIVGLNPHNVENKLSFPLLLYAAAIQTYIAFNIIRDISEPVCKPPLCKFNILKDVQPFTNVIVLLSLVVWKSVMRNNGLKVLDMIVCLDDKFAKLGMKVTYTTYYMIKTLSLGLVPIVFFISNAFIFYYPTKTTLEQIISGALKRVPLTSLYFLSRENVLILDVLARHYAVLRRRLGRMRVGSLSEVPAMVDLALLYSSLCDASDATNKTHCRQILLFAATIFFNATGGLFIFVNSLALRKDHLSTSQLLLYVIWISFWLIQWIVLLLDIVRPSRRCHREV